MEIDNSPSNFILIILSLVSEWYINGNVDDTVLLGGHLYSFEPEYTEDELTHKIFCIQHLNRSHVL